MSYITIDDPPNSRLFVVAGRNTSSEFLRGVFEQYGQVLFVKYLRDKGVAYVKYDRASAAALAIENLHEVTLNDGQGPRLKVMLADSPHSRTLPVLQMPMHRLEEEVLLDPDNTPPRSRLFMVVPKNADGSVIEAEMNRFSGMQYCKTDLIASKGIVFVKYATSSSACMAMEAVQMTGAVAGYKVKIMLAEPKARRSDSFPAFALGRAASLQSPPQLPDQNHHLGASAMLSSMKPALLNRGMDMQDFSALQASVGQLHGSFGNNLGGIAPGSGGMAGPHIPGSIPLDTSPVFGSGSGNYNGLGGLHSDYMALNGLGLGPSMLPPGGGAPHVLHTLDNHMGLQGMPMNGASNPDTRLFVVVHKSATEETLASLFHCFPGLAHIDLKRDRVTGRSKGYAYVTYLSPETAAAAQAQLNGIEYPPGTGSQLKVLFAEPLAISRTRSADMEQQQQQVNAFSNSTNRVQNVSSGGSEGLGLGQSTLLGTPSQDTAATAFHLSSPNSNESVAASRGLNLQAPTLGQLPVPHLQLHQAQQQQQQHSARTDFSSASHESARSIHSSPLRLNNGNEGLGMGSLLDSRAANIAINLGALNLGTDVAGTPINGLGRRASPPTSLSRGSGGISDASGGEHGSWREASPEALSHPTSARQSPAKPFLKAGVNIQDPKVVYSALSRPLPEFALAPVFQRCGPVEYIHVMPEERVALVKYATEEAAAAAVGLLDGAEVMGEILQVRSSPPLPMRTSGLGAIGSGLLSSS